MTDKPEKRMRQVVDECADCDICRYLMDTSCLMFPELYRLWDNEKERCTPWKCWVRPMGQNRPPRAPERPGGGGASRLYCSTGMAMGFRFRFRFLTGAVKP